MEIEQEAQLMGWVPLEQFRGDPEKWTSAQEFVDRGKHLMPILRKNNERLVGEIEALTGKVTQLQSSLNEASESMQALKVFHEESTKAQIERARKELIEELKAAKQAGDVDQEVELGAKLSEFDAARKAVEKDVKEAKPVEKKPPEPEISPEVRIWMQENPWYGSDQERTGLAMGIAQKLRAENSPLKGRDFLEAVAQIVEQRLGAGSNTPLAPAPEYGASKVEGGGRGALSGFSREGYAGLPQDARAECDRQASKFVGPNKAFKTVAEWNSYYAKEFNRL